MLRCHGIIFGEARLRVQSNVMRFATAEWDITLTLACLATYNHPVAIMSKSEETRSRARNPNHTRRQAYHSARLAGVICDVNEPDFAVLILLSLAPGDL